VTNKRVLDLTLTLLDDLVASERPATEGGHESLDYIPGSMLLGAVAARLYGRLSRADAYEVFHSGRMRFGDGVPLTDGNPGWPMPLCWHHAKGEDPRKDGRLDPAHVGHLSELPEREQPKQLREGYVRSDGLMVRPKRSLRMKTAIDPKTGRVAESQLFGYESVTAGPSYAARIEANPGLRDDLWQLVAELFGKPTQFLLGRSRSAEYGRVRVEPAKERLALPTSAAPSPQLRLWCLTDLALLDDWGQPTLQPTPAHFGLDRGRLDPDGTFLRFRRFAPWNAHRQAYDLQRQVVRRGSVIVFTGIDPPLTEAERARIEAGVGLHREQGMGRLCIDPEILATQRPRFAEAVEATDACPPIPRPEDPLILWLKRQLEGGGARREAERQARAQADALKKCYALARAYAGIPQGVPVGPSPAQWGRVYEAARTATDRGTLPTTLFEGDNAICKPNGENWRDPFRDAQGVRSFRDWLHDVAMPALTSRDAVRAFGREAQRIAQREHGRGASQED
jgi:CRISPR-associated protein Csx10